MHVIVPETFWVDSSNRFYYDDERGNRLYIDPMLFPESEEGSKLSHTLWWQEHRRKTFSDVCHAKLVEPTDFLGESPTGLYLYKTVSPTNHRYGSCCYSIDRDYGNEQVKCCRLISNGCIALLTTIHIYRYSNTRKYIYLDSFLYRFKEWTTSAKVTPRYQLKRSHLTLWFNPVTGSYTVKSTSPDTLGISDYMTDLAHNYMPEMYIPTLNQSALVATSRSIADRIFAMTWYCHEQSPLDRSGSTYTPSKVTDAELVSGDRDFFLLREPQVIMNHVDDILLGNGTEKYFRNVLIQNAFVDAVRNVPRLNDNSISNILEIISFIVGIVVHKRVDIPNSLSSAWLSYRYTYGTGKADLEEAIRFVHRSMDLGKWDQLKTYGSYSLVYKDVPIICRCVFEITNKKLQYVQRIWKALYTYGLKPNFYVVWDMIPYSFIVDWFIPIGNVATSIDVEDAVKEYYRISDINMSLSYDRTLEDGRHISCYTRWLTSTPPALHGYYFLEDDPSRRTIIKRVIDATSLLLG